MNTGHGHVWPRTDGVKARCGGPALCRQCARDLADKQSAAGRLPASTGEESMTTHQGLPVAGYQPQSDVKVRTVNTHKQAEERVLRLIDDAKQNPDHDQRWVAIARTQIEQGFMALNRAVFKPGRLELPEDGA